MTSDRGNIGGTGLELSSTPVTPKSQGLNPNANVFQSKTPSSTLEPLGQWEYGENNMAPTTLIATTTTTTSSTDGGHQYMNGDIGKMHSPIYSPTILDSRVPVSDFAMNGGVNSSIPVALEIPFSASSEVPTAQPASPESPVSLFHGAKEKSIAEEKTPKYENQPLENSIPQDELKAMLQQQLEYYFSRENLASDTYLVSQMDSDQYVPIWTVANFNQIKKLTNDINLVVEVLRESPNVQVDEGGEKVRPNHKRCIVILREIPEMTPLEEVRALFSGENCPKIVSCEFAHNSSWYVTFESDEDAQRAYRYLREEVKAFQGKPIMGMQHLKNDFGSCEEHVPLVLGSPYPRGGQYGIEARIKAKPITRASFVPKNGYRTPAAEPSLYLQQQRYPYPPSPGIQPQPMPFNGPQVEPFTHFYPPSIIQAWTPTSPTYFDLGTVFTMNGFAPQAAFKPNATTNRHNFPLPRNRSRHRRRRREDDSATRTARQGFGQAATPKENKSPSPKFDFEAASFPPLPGSTNTAKGDSEVFENRMADVVKGTAKPATKDSKTQTPLSPITKDSSTLTNGDVSVLPSSPSRVSKATSTADKSTKTDEPILVNSMVLKINQPSTGTQTTTTSTTSTIITSPVEDKPLKLSYAQMAQRAKEKVEKLAQEQKEKQEQIAKERNKEMALATTNKAKDFHKVIKETQKFRERDRLELVSSRNFHRTRAQKENEPRDDRCRDTCPKSPQ